MVFFCDFGKFAELRYFQKCSEIIYPLYLYICGSSSQILQEIAKLGHLWKLEQQKIIEQNTGRIKKSKKMLAKSPWQLKFSSAKMLVG